MCLAKYSVYVCICSTHGTYKYPLSQIYCCSNTRLKSILWGSEELTFEDILLPSLSFLYCKHLFITIVLHDILREMSMILKVFSNFLWFKGNLMCRLIYIKVFFIDIYHSIFNGINATKMLCWEKPKLSLLK